MTTITYPKEIAMLTAIANFLVIIAYIVFGGAVLFVANVFYFEYCVLRNKDIAAEQYNALFGDPDAALDEAVDLGNSHSPS